MHRSNMRKRFLPFLVVFVALTAIMMTVAFAEGEAEYVSNFYASPLSLLPPVIAIILALITKEVYSSLFVGILVGGLLYANFNPELTIMTMFFNEDGLERGHPGVPGYPGHHGGPDEQGRRLHCLR